MCKGGGPPRFQVKPDVDQTMQEMMQALMQPNTRGTGQGGTGGSGSGMGGSGDDGFSMAGQSANIPVYGPDRMAFAPPTGRSGRGGNSRHGKIGIATERPRVELKPDELRQSEQAQLLQENVPDKYRNAVKRYFSQDPKTKTTTTSP